MTISFSISDLLILLVSFPILLFSTILGIGLLLKKEGHRLNNFLFGLLLLLGGFTVSNQALYVSGIAYQYHFLYFLPIDYSLAIGPVLYLNIRAKVHPDMFILPRDMIHFILPTLQAALYFSIGFLPVVQKDILWNEGFLPIYMEWEGIVFILSIFIYIFLSYRLISEHIKLPKKWDEDLKNWLFLFLKILIILVISELIFIIPEWIGYDFKIFEYLQLSLELCLLTWLNLKAFDQYFPHRIYSSQLILESLVHRTKEKVSKDSLYSDLLSNLLDDQKIYRNPDLNLEIMSRQLGMSKPRTSKLISEQFGLNFNALLNEYRLKDVLNALQEGQHQERTLLSIALDAGFSSKSTFYRFFRQKMGMTPSDFIQNRDSLKKG